MPQPPFQHELPPAVRRLLDDVRRRIRAYVWLQGLALVAVLVGTAFWLGLLVDWSFEPSAAVRRVELTAFALVALYVLYRHLLRRVAVPISDSTAAALLERRFPLLDEHLLTAVDVAASSERAAACHPDFVHQTQQSAAHAVAQVRPGELFNRAPLARAIWAAAALAISIALFALVSSEAFAFWLDRIALSDQPWPRRAHLAVVGFPPDVTGQRVHKLAQDDDFELLVQAQAGAYVVPDEVEIRFRLADGRRGRDTMIRVGEAQSARPVSGVSDPDRNPDAGPKQNEYQLFRYGFKRVAGDMEFDVVGGDDRVRDLRLAVVDRPELFAIELECVYPPYLGRESRRLSVTGGMRIPEGTRLVLHARATKPLTAARIHAANDKKDNQLEFADRARDELRWEYGTLSDDDVLLVSVTDSDGVATRDPYRVSLAVVRDEVPQVAVRLAGIGSAITPDAMLPLVGKVTDDYGLDRAWFEFQVDTGPLATRPLAAQPAGETMLNKLNPFDLRATDESTGKRALQLQPGQRFKLTLKATDHFNLLEKPRAEPGAGISETDLSEASSNPAQRAGSSQQFTLDVVTPGNLLALLERQELALRQRYEAIYEKMTDTRNLLARVEFEDEAAFSANDAESSASPSSSEREQAGGTGNDDGPQALAPSSASTQRALARRRLRVAGSLQNVMQSADEIAGIAEGFHDLGEQLTNNRVDNPDLKSRLREQIALPLRRIAEQRMPELAAQLKLVEQHVEDAEAGAPELAKTLTLADEVLVEMRQVLDRMLELETYNEVVSLLRDIITDQGEINRRTKERQKERLRSLFEE